MELNGEWSCAFCRSILSASTRDCLLCSLWTCSTCTYENNTIPNTSNTHCEVCFAQREGLSPPSKRRRIEKQTVSFFCERVFLYSVSEIDNYLPSKTQRFSIKGQIDWIQARGSRDSFGEEVDRNLEVCKDEIQSKVLDEISQRNIKGKKMSKEESKEHIEKMLALATFYKITSAKFMFFYNKTDIDEKWKIIAKETIEDNLGGSSKVASNDPLSKPSSFLICVYVDDFNDKENVQRVREKLTSLGFTSKNLKPDIFTYLNLNTGNPYKLPVTIEV